MPIFDHAQPKSLNQTLSFLNLHQHAKNHFIPSIHLCNTENFRVLWPYCSHPFLSMSTPPKWSTFNFCGFASTCKKITLCHRFVLEILLINNILRSDWLRRFWPYLRNLNFPKYGICAGTQHLGSKKSYFIFIMTISQLSFEISSHLPFLNLPLWINKWFLIS